MNIRTINRFLFVLIIKLCFKFVLDCSQGLCKSASNSFLFRCNSFAFKYLHYIAQSPAIEIGSLKPSYLYPQITVFSFVGKLKVNFNLPNKVSCDRAML